MPSAQKSNKKKFTDTVSSKSEATQSLLKARVNSTSLREPNADEADIIACGIENHPDAANAREEITRHVVNGTPSGLQYRALRDEEVYLQNWPALTQQRKPNDEEAKVIQCGIDNHPDGENARYYITKQVLLDTKEGQLIRAMYNEENGIVVPKDKPESFFHGR